MNIKYKSNKWDTLTEEIVKVAREVFVEPKKTTDGKKFPLLVYKKSWLYTAAGTTTIRIKY